MQRILDRYQINYPFLLYAGRTNPPQKYSRAWSKLSPSCAAKSRTIPYIRTCA